MNDRTDTPNSFPWPPVILVSALISAWYLHELVPLTLPTELVILGVAIIIVALAIDVAAMHEMCKAQTTIMPHRGTTTLVTGGVFRVSRNPIYVANVLLIVGLGLVSTSAWPLLAAPFAAYAMQVLAIQREEQHLLANFGDEYAAYCGQVRRWV